MLSMQKTLVIGVVLVVAVAGGAAAFVAINNGKDKGSSDELTLTVGTLDTVNGTNFSAVNARYVVQDIMYLLYHLSGSRHLLIHILLGAPDIPVFNGFEVFEKFTF